ncbi:MAG: hypothetical protein ACOYCB_13290 [Fastidiosipilaceae bacterium]
MGAATCFAQGTSHLCTRRGSGARRLCLTPAIVGRSGKDCHRQAFRGRSRLAVTRRRSGYPHGAGRVPGLSQAYGAVPLPSGRVSGSVRVWSGAGRPPVCQQASQQIGDRSQALATAVAITAAMGAQAQPAVGSRQPVSGVWDGGSSQARPALCRRVA